MLSSLLLPEPPGGIGCYTGQDDKYTGRAHAQLALGDRAGFDAAVGQHVAAARARPDVPMRRGGQLLVIHAALDGDAAARRTAYVNPASFSDPDDFDWQDIRVIELARALATLGLGDLATALPGLYGT
jgi:hypothetical protein